ncbi:MAG: DinB family protein [Acidobacteria bacterium]|nr:DinB family protein [Acidobacteriota bacterium]
MILVDTLRELYDYNWWARDRQLGACAALTPEQFLRPVGGSFPSLRDTLAHLVGVEWLYLERWQGRSPVALPAATVFPTLELLRARWREVERDIRAVLAGLTDARLAQPITYTNMKGETKTFAVWRIFYHLLNHQSYHRGQVTTQLRLLGAVPLQVDYGLLLFQRVQGEVGRQESPPIPLASWKELFEYNHWARDRQLAACAGLSQESFLRPLGSSFSSIRDTLVHLVQSEWVWLENWRGRSPTPQYKEQFAPDKFPSIAAIRDRWAEVERDLHHYLAGLSEDAPARPFTYDRQGQTLTFTLWRLFYHLLNHQSYHRGQVTTQLRLLGAVPPQVDYYYWLSTRQ